ncbi:DNA helicase [Forsythia ovata]|uniref:DNA helicase n=1 Tax=Forsythia ovata TaxID=205694 RepID=A0ABD1R8D7_9LAMI
MGWSERESCIKCDKGGKLLVCSENGCPISVHEICMGCPARFDERGLFYCPYCLYRKAVAESCQARENAMSKKKALSIFIDEEMIGGTKQVEKKESAEVKRLNGNGNVNKTICCNSNKDTDMVYNQPIQLEEEPQAKGISHECTRSPSPCKGADASILDSQNDSQNDELTGSSEGHKEDTHKKDSTYAQHTTIPSRRKPDNVERQEHINGSAEEEKMQEEVKENSAAPSGEAPLVPAHSRAKRGVLTNDSIYRESEVISMRSKRVKRSDVNKKQSPSPSKGADASRLDNQNDVLSGSSEGYIEDVHMNDSTEVQETIIPSRRKLDTIEMQEEHIISSAEEKMQDEEKRCSAEEEKMQEEVKENSAAPSGEVPLVRAHSRAKRGVLTNDSTCRESEVISMRSKRVKRSDVNKKQSPLPCKGADASRLDNQNDVLSGSSEGYKEDVDMNDSTEVQETIIPSGRELDNIEKQEEHIISSAEEKMQDEEQETSAKFTGKVPLVQAHSRSKRGVETNKSICRESELISTRSKDVKRNDMNKKQSPGADSPRRSRRSSSNLGINKEKYASRSSRLIELPSAKSPKDPFPNDRRKKLLWTEEEEEMLREGVEKFSAQANKNIPWRKVLEFGRHVFHGTRTPADLKDKWRNIAAKGSAAK